MGGNDFVKETARDFVALGGFPFFALVLARVWMLDNVVYFTQFVVAGVVFGFVFLKLRQNLHAGFGLIVLVFTSLYYGDVLFWMFGSVVYCLLIGSLVYLDKSWKSIALGVLAGALGVGISFIYPYL